MVPSALSERDPNSTSTSHSDVVDASDILRSKESVKQAAGKKGAEPSAKSNASTQTNNKKSSTDKAPSAADLSRIHLHGEEDEEVPIYEPCNEIRTKMRQHMKQLGVTQASMAREFSEMMPHSKISPRHISKFLDIRGPRAGGHSPAFHGGYVYSEKLRIHQNKKKSKKREEMEDIWAKHGGFPREESHNVYMTLQAGER